MPKDERGKKVEKWKLTPEQMTFSKQFKKVKAVGELLKNAVLKNMLEGQELRGFMKQLQMGLNYMKPPSDQVQELPGQDFTESPQEAADTLETGMQAKPDFHLKY